MARSSKRSKGGGRQKSRMKYDWVVNDSTYGNVSIVANAGVAAFPLTYPQMQLVADINTGGAVGGYAYPETRQKQFVKAVSGWMTYEPSSWVAGVRSHWLARIVKKPMDYTTGDAIADALYSLFSAVYANERFAWQHCQFEPFNTGSNFANLVRVRATVNQWLEPDEALYMVFESDNLGVSNNTIQFYLRTLMGVPA